MSQVGDGSLDLSVTGCGLAGHGWGTGATYSCAMADAIPGRTIGSRIALVAMLFAAQGCAAWTPAVVAPSSLDTHPREVRVTLVNGERFPVSLPRIEGDTLRGRLAGIPDEPVALALSDIKALDLAREDTNMAINLAAVGGIIVFWLGIMAACAAACD